MTERYHVLSQLEHLQSKYVGTGHPETPRWELCTNQHRDSYASYLGHPDVLSLMALCENETRARIKFVYLQRMVSPCGPPPEKSATDNDL